MLETKQCKCPFPLEAAEQNQCHLLSNKHVAFEVVVMERGWLSQKKRKTQIDRVFDTIVSPMALFV